MLNKRRQKDINLITIRQNVSCGLFTTIRKKSRIIVLHGLHSSKVITNTIETSDSVQRQTVLGSERI